MSKIIHIILLFFLHVAYFAEGSRKGGESGAPPNIIMHVSERINDSLECYKILIDRISMARLDIEKFYTSHKDHHNDTTQLPGIMQKINDAKFEYISIYDVSLQINPFPHEVYEILMSIVTDLIYIDEIKLLLKNATHDVGLRAIEKHYDGTIINQLIYEPRNNDCIDKIKHTIAECNAKTIEIPAKIEKTSTKYKQYDALVNEIHFDISHCIYRVIKINNDDLMHMKVTCELLLKSLNAIDPSLIKNDKVNNQSFYT
jgi:hypothetical protein